MPSETDFMGGVLEAGSMIKITTEDLANVDDWIIEAFYEMSKCTNS